MQGMHSSNASPNKAPSLTTGRTWSSESSKPFLLTVKEYFSSLEGAKEYGVVPSNLPFLSFTSADEGSLSMVILLALLLKIVAQPVIVTTNENNRSARA